MANPVIINPTLTLAGQAAAINASNTGLELIIDGVSFGRAHYEPDGEELALVDPVGSRVPFAGGSRPTLYQLRLSAAWKEDVGVVPIAEIGFWAGDVLVFVWSDPDPTVVATYKTDGVPYVLFCDLAFAQVPAGSITIVTDPDESAALAALTEHEGASNAHPQYLLREDVAKDAGPLMGLVHSVGSTANALLLALDAPESVLPAYAKFQRFQFLAALTNTTAVTVNVEGLGPIAVKRGGDTGLVPLDPGDIKAGSLYDLNYDGTFFQLGGGVGGGKAFERFSFVAGVAQNEFIFPHVPGNVIALRNGREIDGVTSAVDGSKVTTAIAMNLDDRMDFLAFKSFRVADSYTKTELNALLLTAGALPVGSMLPVPKGVVPPGYLELDGSVQSIAVYPDLAAYLGTTFNTGGEGAGNFRLPESRGEFLRGWDHGRGVDAGRAIGSWQKGTMTGADTTGSGDGLVVVGLGGTAAAPISSYGMDPVTLTDYPPNLVVSGTGTSAIAATTAVIGSTRPRNLAVMWCIKAWNAPINQGNIDIAALAQKVADNEFGRLLGIQKFTANGLYVPTLGMKKVRLRQCGGGAGSSGVAATSATQTSASGGGAAGGYSESLLTAADIGASQVVTIGAAGLAGAAAAVGGPGGTTSLGALVITPGGFPSSVGTVVASTAFNLFAGGAPGALPTGGNLLNSVGEPGAPAILVSASTLAGHGGSGPLGAGGFGTSGTPNPGSGYGSGGGGVANGISSAAKPGAPGGPGVMFLEEYA